MPSVGGRYVGPLWGVSMPCLSVELLSRSRSSFLRYNLRPHKFSSFLCFVVTAKGLRPSRIMANPPEQEAAPLGKGRELKRQISLLSAPNEVAKDLWGCLVRFW